ncbi:TonB-dependent receptor plug domain-containing protein [Alteromonas sp. a30]|uniref:TonB-dependent receptor plug domain-containing protein n=1 Tax=Alteromonas sp. a30 TaxID=2730917 RepID=UPI00227DB6B3|nr:TonB-dependent receptor [Alteromonas sp. a30]MCY7294713.1 TonB-dependent receptor [Alteromonas sp. a30]
MQFNKSLVTLSVGTVFSCFGHSAESISTPSIETISVVSSRVEQPLSEMATSVTVLTEADLDALGQISLADTLRSVTSVGVSNSGGLGKVTTVRIRGEEGFRTTVLVDGVDLADPSAPQITPVFDDLLTSQVQRVEILRGPQGLLYGADAGGVIRITSSELRPGTSGEISVQMGAENTQQYGAKVGYANETSHVFLSAGKTNSDGFNAQKADESGEEDGYENTTLHLKAETKLTDSLSVNLVLRDVDSQVDYDGCSDNVTFATTHVCASEAEQETQRLAFVYKQEQYRQEVSYSNTDVRRDSFSNNLLGFTNEGKIKKFGYLGEMDFDNHRIVGGFEKKEESIPTEKRDQHSLFAEYQYQYDKRWTTTAGIRHDDNDTFGTNTSYRLGSAYLIESGLPGTLKLKATYGTGFRAPSLFEQAYNDGDFAFGAAKDLQLTEETSEGFDIGAEWFLDNTFVGITYFNQKIEDEIQFDPVSFQGYLQTEGESESKGVEVEWHHTPSSQVKLWGNYTYNDSETQTGEQRLRRPEHLANVGINLFNQSGEFSVNANAHWEKDAIDIGGEPLDDFTTINLSAQYQLSDTVKLNARIDNVFNREYEQVKGFNTASRSAFVGAEWQF